MRMRMNKMLPSEFGNKRRWGPMAVIVAAASLVLGPRVSIAQAAAPFGQGATHATHQSAVASNADQELLKQIAELRAQVARLLALVEQQNPASQKPAPGMGGKPQADMMKDKMEMMMGMGMDKAEMAGMAGGGMPGGAGMAAGGTMKMDKGEMGMPPAEMKMEMGGMGGQPAASGGATASKASTMAMSQQSSGATSVSALPGVPGASHLYHIGSTGFFLDQPQLKLSTDQQARLNQIKERAVLARATSERRIEQAEQELWVLTGAGQPDAAKIQPKLQEIEQLRTSQRLAFITAVGEATSLLTLDQRDAILGVKK